jgi:hypothetical protein
MTNINDQIQELLETLKNSSGILVPAIGKEATEAGASILSWVNYLKLIHNNHSAIELLDGTESALVESCAYCCLGLGRASIVSIRTQVDLLLSYTYFRDHPKEWKRVQDRGEGFVLFAGIIKHHGEMDTDFNKRHEMVKQVVKPNLEELYGVMSAHIHAQSALTVPTSHKMKDIVLKKDKMVTILDLQQKTSLALSATLLAIYSKNWRDLPPELYKSTHSLMSRKQATIFFN